MRIGITSYFRGSAFSGSLPQVAVYLSRALTEIGHEVEFILPQDSDDWFIDCKDAAILPRVKIETGTAINTYDMLIEVVWHLPPNIRTKIAKKTVMFFHYPAVFYDIENSVYPMASMNRDFTSVDSVWTWSHFKKTDVAYLELISKRPVFKIPFLWDPVFSDLYVKESSIKQNTGDYEVVICESNESNTSNCTIPLTILSEIYKKTPVKWSVLNGNTLIERPFFVSNILNNLSFDQTDISGNFSKRVRLPDLLRRPAIIISHQRWRPLKYMLLDALHLGIPIVHNSELLKGIAGGEFYNLNSLGDAISAFDKLIKSDNRTLNDTREVLLSRFGIKSAAKLLSGIVDKTFEHSIVERGKLQLAFFDMWVDFQPSYNTILSALKNNGVSVDINQSNPNLIIFGPFGEENTRLKWATVPKIFWTGEPLKPFLRDDIILNIGFRRNLSFSYFRLPLWMTELNWYNEPNVELYKNPVPFPLDMLNIKVGKVPSKFCAFVASNPRSYERNTAYNILSRYKKVDSAGRLFSNTEAIPGGPGGSGGQMQKVEFYKNYKFVLTCENSRSNGYLTEKLLHAKLAGCVPIYWGDPYVDLDFNPESFINITKFSSAEEFLNRVKEIDENDELWLKMANSPLILNIEKAKAKLGLLVDAIVESVTAKTEGTGEKAREPVFVPSVSNSSVSSCSFVSSFNPVVANNPSILYSSLPNDRKGPLEANTGAYPVVPICNKSDKVIVTCCNHNYVPCAVKLILTSKYPVYVWGINITDEDKVLLTRVGATVNDFDTSWRGLDNWQEFWNMEYYAWKPLMLWLSSKTFVNGTNVLYLDAGIEITNDLDSIWSEISEKGFFVLEMPEHKMRVWSHPTFCSLLQLTEEELNAPQYSANIVGFKNDGSYDQMFEECLKLASNKDVIGGKKWFRYSDECFGHRHDQSILSLLGFRKGIKPRLLYDYIGEKSLINSQRLGHSFYVHRGLWKPLVPIAENIDEAFVINLEHRGDRLEKFWGAHPYLKDSVYKTTAVNGNNLQLNKEIVRLFRNNDFNWKKGVMGCALSHYNLWLELANHKHSKTYLILEDDVVLDQNFLYKWRSVAHLMPDDADVVFLGGVLPPNKAALPVFTEPVNAAFAKVKEMELGGSRRRYFHFCTYSYIITKAGAKKLCSLIGENGIFTSIDHMMVNHGDSLLNIYFTTPLLSGCFQDNDPAYINADFNNFNRVDKFDSEIWNNVENFTKAEIALVSEQRRQIKFVYFEDKQKDCIEQDWLEEVFSQDIVWVSASDEFKKGERVVIYYQHTTATSIIEGWVNRHSDLNMILFHASDESCKADVSLYLHPLIKTVFRNYWRPECVTDKVIHLPLGYLKGKNGPFKDSILDRKYTWSFAGALDRKGRKDQLAALCSAAPNHKLHGTPTWNSPSNLGKYDYVNNIRSSKFVPCLAGFYNVESYRFYETLENGAIPIIPLDEKNSYANIFSGSMNPPTLALTDMGSLGKIIPILDSNPLLLENIHKDMQNWWSGYKLFLRKLISSRID